VTAQSSTAAECLRTGVRIQPLAAIVRPDRPFDGWDIPAGRSAIAEVSPSLWRRGFAPEGRTPDQHDAFCIAVWLARADRDGTISGLLKPDLSPAERVVAQIEGWILGVPGLIRAAGQHKDSLARFACSPSRRAAKINQTSVWPCVSQRGPIG
jgi:hypothetical protein